MALDIAETTYTPVNARVVQDRTAQRALEVAAPAIGEAVVGFAEGQLQREIGNVETQAMQTQAYINDLRAQQASLDPAQTEELAAMVELNSEMDRVMKGQKQGMMSSTQAAARISAAARRLSRQFPVAAGSIRAMVSPGSVSAMTTGALNQLAAEEERYQAVRAKKDTDMIAAGLDPSNATAVRNWDIVSMQTQDTILKTQIASREAALLQAENSLNAARNTRTANDLERSTFEGFDINLTKLMNSLERDERGGIKNSAVALSTVDSLVTEAQQNMLQVQGLQGVDIGPALARLNTLGASMKSLIENGTVAKVNQALLDEFSTTTMINLQDKVPSFVFLASKFPKVIEGKMDAALAGKEYLDLYEEAFHFNDINAAIELTRSLETRTVSQDDADKITAILDEIPSLEMAPELRDAAFEGLGEGRMNRFLKGAGREYSRDNPVAFNNRFNSETTAIANDPTLQTSLAGGNSFTYDENSKTLVVLDSNGRYVQHYTMPQGRTKVQQAAANGRAQQFIQSLPGLNQEPGDTVGGRARIPANMAPKINNNVLRKLTENLENLRVNADIIKDYNIGTYFDVIRSSVVPEAPRPPTPRENLGMPEANFYSNALATDPFLNRNQ
jgi:hypothetical protein